MSRRRPARVFQLRVVPPGGTGLLTFARDEFSEWAPRIAEALTPGARIARYGRDWIVGQTEERNGVITGRIGFQGEPGTAEVWDESRRDFIETAIPSGMTSPFAVDTHRLKIAVQPRNPTIKVNGLIGAFEALLTGDGKRWHLEPLREPMSLAQWKAYVQKVTHVRLTIKEPNPHYHDAHNLEELMQQMASEVIQLEARSEDGLDLDAPFLRETEGHIERGYGEAEYRGVSHDGETIYSTKVGAEEQAELLPVDELTGEVPQDDLRSLLGDGDGEGGDSDDESEDPGDSAV